MRELYSCEMEMVAAAGVIIDDPKVQYLPGNVDNFCDLTNSLLGSDTGIPDKYLMS